MKHSRHIMRSIDLFLHGLIDYAGLFPPAKLEMTGAASQYAHHLASPERHALARFVCPVGRLGELAAALDSRVQVSIAALGRGGVGFDEFSDTLAADLLAILDFNRKAPERLLVDVLEVKVPPALAIHARRGNLAELVSLAMQMVESTNGAALRVFFEVPLLEGTEDDLRSAIRAVLSGQGSIYAAGVKLRTGGLEAASFPTAERLALAIETCRAAGGAFKCTAGLHHPLRHFNAGVGARMHGFVNVFGGAILLHAGAIDQACLVQLLEDEEAAAWEFREEAISWRGKTATRAAIDAARREFAISYGSCSFTEPTAEFAAMLGTTL